LEWEGKPWDTRESLSLAHTEEGISVLGDELYPRFPKTFVGRGFGAFSRSPFERSVAFQICELTLEAIAPNATTANGRRPAGSSVDFRS
jgi:hypothetical protein